MEPWVFDIDGGPVLAVALHAGHEVRPEVARFMALSEDDRLREEDPATDRFAQAAPSRVIVRRSRFEVDLNRPRERCVYSGPADAWGLHVWRAEPPPQVTRSARRLHTIFYRRLRDVLDRIVERHGGFVLLDLHSYNHRRGGPSAPPDDPTANPDVNVGTSNLDRDHWYPVFDAFASALSEALGPATDIRENVKFRGGFLSRWVNERYLTGCALAIEFKKTYMDEWSGEIDHAAVRRITEALHVTVHELEAALLVVIGDS